MKRCHEDLRKGWPRSLIEVADVIGDDAALELQAAFAGQRVYIPLKPKDTSRVARAVGMRAARLLGACGFGGLYLDVPSHSFIAARNKREAIEREPGSAPRVAAKFGCSERWVRMVRREARNGAPPR